MKLISAAIVGALLLVSLIVPLSSQASAAEESSTVAVLVDFGNGRVEWVDVPVTSSMNVFNVTEQAMIDLGLQMVAQNWGTEDNPSMFIDTINGIGFNDKTYEYWGLWVWNDATGTWEMSMEGASTIPAVSVSAISWFYSSSTFGSLATPEHRYPWTSFRHDSMNTGSQPASAPNNLTLLWNEDLGNGAIDSPIVGTNGKVYVVTGGILNFTNWGYDTNSTVYCLDENGVVWSAEIGKGYQVASPLLFGDKLVVPSANGKIYTFDAEDGDLLWTFNTGPSVYGITSSPILYENDIIFASSNGKVYSVNEYGMEKWNTTISQVIYSSSPAAKDGTIYIGADDGKLHALASNGTGEKWAFTLGSKVRGSPILMDDKIVVSYLIYNGSSPVSGGLAAVSYEGSLLWNVSTGVSPASPALTNSGFALMTADGMSMIGPDGVKLWNISLGTAFAGGAPITVSGSVFAVTNEAESRLVAVSDAGELYFQEKLLPAQYALCAPTVIDNLLYVASDNGCIYAFRMNSVLPSSIEFEALPSGLEVMFGLKSLEIDSSLYYYAWDYGDGNTSQGMPGEHVYEKAGTYTVTLNVSNPAGAYTTESISVTVAPRQNDTGDNTIWIVGILVIVLAAIAVIAVVMMRRKK